MREDVAVTIRRPRTAVPALVTTWVGTAMFVAGLVVLVHHWTHPATSFGWFAYAPLSDTVFTPGPSPAFVVGVALTVVGAALGAFGAGVLVGRRSR
jgi:heme/copper-type cytochrome/quinol oxidase subunit 1